MIHYLNSLSITEKLYETLPENDGDFRFAAIEANLAAYTENYAAWHWHEVMELACVVDGAVDCFTPRHRLSLKAGEGYFFNSGILHMNRISDGSNKGTLRVIQFGAGILSGAGAIIERFILPVEKNTAIECLPLQSGDAILDDLAAVFKLAAGEPHAYELDAIRLLLGIWKNLYTALEPALQQTAPADDTAAMRMKGMLAYIHSRYDAPMTVAEIAAAVNISEREAYRTFRDVLKTTPTLYIQQYRVNNAARLLKETDRPITEISLECGFSSPNYFNGVFKGLMRMSPREFRKRGK